MLWQLFDNGIHLLINQKPHLKSNKYPVQNRIQIKGKQLSQWTQHTSSMFGLTDWSGAEHDGMDLSGAEWNIDFISLFVYFLYFDGMELNKLVHSILHPKLGECKLKDWMEYDRIDSIIFQFAPSIIPKFI